MFPLAHSNYRDISLILKSAVSTIPPFRHIFKERLHLYYTKKVFIIQTILELFFLSKRRAVVPTHTQFNLCELFSRQPLFPTGLLSKVYRKGIKPLLSHP